VLTALPGRLYLGAPLSHGTHARARARTRTHARAHSRCGMAGLSATDLWHHAPTYHINQPSLNGHTCKVCGLEVANMAVHIHEVALGLLCTRKHGVASNQLSYLQGPCCALRSPPFTPSLTSTSLPSAPPGASLLSCRSRYHHPAHTLRTSCAHYHPLPAHNTYTHTQHTHTHAHTCLCAARPQVHGPDGPHEEIRTGSGSAVVVHRCGRGRRWLRASGEGRGQPRTGCVWCVSVSMVHHSLLHLLPTSLSCSSTFERKLPSPPRRKRDNKFLMVQEFAGAGFWVPGVRALLHSCNSEAAADSPQHGACMGPVLAGVLLSACEPSLLCNQGSSTSQHVSCHIQVEATTLANPCQPARWVLS